jgi:hypothetical protein
MPTEWSITVYSTLVQAYIPTHRHQFPVYLLIPPWVTRNHYGKKGRTMTFIKWGLTAITGAEAIIYDWLIGAKYNYTTGPSPPHIPSTQPHLFSLLLVWCSVVWWHSQPVTPSVHPALSLALSLSLSGAHFPPHWLLLTVELTEFDLIIPNTCST